MLLNTASAVISFYSKFEDQIAGLYERLANNEKYAAGKDTFLTLAVENRRHKELVERAYREVITDALEACFAFTIDDSGYSVNTELGRDVGYSDIVKKMIDIERTSHKFCLDVSEKSKCLMSDVPQAFTRVA